MSRDELAARQAELVAALVAGGPMPAGFDEAGVRAAATALLRKRAGEVAAAWPALRAYLDDRWTEVFDAWAAGRPPRGSLRDGWDLARQVLPPAPGGLRHAEALIERAQREARLVYDGANPPRARRLPAVRRTPSATVVQLAGRTFTRRRGSG